MPLDFDFTPYMGKTSVIKRDNGRVRLENAFTIFGFNFKGKLFAAVGLGLAVTGEVDDNTPHDREIMKKLLSIVHPDHGKLLVVGLGSDGQWFVSFIYPRGDGTYAEVAYVSGTHLQDTVQCACEMAVHVDFNDNVVTPALSDLKKPISPDIGRFGRSGFVKSISAPAASDKMTLRDWYVTAGCLLILAAVFGAAMFFSYSYLEMKGFI